MSIQVDSGASIRGILNGFFGQIKKVAKGQRGIIRQVILTITIQRGCATDWTTLSSILLTFAGWQLSGLPVDETVRLELPWDVPPH